MPWSMRTLDTMKLVIMMETTMWSSWLIGLMPLKSLSVKVIGGILRGDGRWHSHVDVPDGVEVMLARLARQPSLWEFTRNGVDYASNLLGGLIFMFLQRLSLASLQMVSLSPLIWCFVPSTVSVISPMLIFLVSSDSRSYWIIVRPLYELS